jgi:protein-S-isoprenylcysteine O-methyltransferase Ste14
MRFLELRVPPLLLVVVFAAAMAGVTRLVPSATIIVPARLAALMSLIALGVAITIAGVVAFRKHETTVNPLAPDEASSLVSTGIYRITRNPMYLGLLLMLAGWCVYLGNGVAALLLPGFVAYMNRFQIGPEERALAAKFGSRFTEYAASVSRWFPLRIRGAPPGR